MCRECNDTDVVNGIDEKIKKHRNNLSRISGIDKQLLEMQSAIHQFYVENGIVQTEVVAMHNSISKILDRLEAVRLKNYEITKSIV
tara:strand:- start:3482 stop:3739 length:258 start_codon:yes stop_codon:yes gene_type:complete